MDDVTMLKLSPVAESMCLRLHDFEAVSTEGTSLYTQPLNKETMALKGYMSSSIIYQGFVCCVLYRYAHAYVYCHAVECGIDHDVFMDCAIHQLPIADQLTFDMVRFSPPQVSFTTYYM